MSTPVSAPPEAHFNPPMPKPTNQATEEPIVSSGRKCPSIVVAFVLLLILARIPTVLNFTSSPSKACNELPQIIERPKFRPKVGDIGFGFACNDDVSKVISTSKRCDGKYDCSNKSDEENCETCQTIFQCPSELIEEDENKSMICLTASQLCDGVQHCPDGSDETSWCKSNCSAEQFKCPGQNVCLPKSAKCDGIADCEDKSDEKDCIDCEAKAHKCGEMCVKMSEVCDGIAQCDDGSDEKGCDCESCCGSDKALCDDGTCILRYQVCDGKHDCSNGMDEKDCPGRCLVKESAMKKRVTCSDGREYTEEEACSGEFHKCYSNCPENCKAFHCPIDKKCISRSAVCDGYVDCVDGADERNCSCNEIERFKCDRKCIDFERKCDGILDCVDMSDEYNCATCASGAFTCAIDQTCLPSSTRCDGVDNCSDGSDEKDCSCDECIGAHSTTYMCDGSTKCLLIDEVCSPTSICPNATSSDEAYCAIQMFRIKKGFPWWSQSWEF
ncbi:unnamed protein product [Caenorhabditis angaria]|uniref:Uncharacterized protein n=1 Tax=Caenorhabditis angaria TaxID=860376 RepID=A0A9P1IUD3_9PELO|nr:unnamed protein product [Caenorhabditis angaria]